MAEGHAVLRWAIALKPLVGEVLLCVQATRRWQERAAALVGETVTAIDTHGKHIVIRISGGWAIHCHAMQYGSWQIGEPGQALRKEARYIRLKLLTALHEAVYFHGPVMEILTEEELAAHPRLHELGPDLLALPFDREEANRRFATTDRPSDPPSSRQIGDAVLDQRLVAGIGNIYKSEGLFLAGIDPRREAPEVGAAELDRLWDVLAPLMHEGVARFGPTITLPPERQGAGDRNWVYRRRGKPCFRCGTKIEMLRQGELKRATYFCPRCQT
jgi:endonuclease-8